MKYRSGFVSNSSSASFIIAVKSVAFCHQCKRSDPNFIDFVEDNSGEDYETTKMYARGSKDVVNWTKNNVGYEGNKPEDNLEWDEVFKKVLEAEKEDKQVACISIAYHDEVTDLEFSRMKRRGLVEVLWTDH